MKTIQSITILSVLIAIGGTFRSGHAEIEIVGRTNQPNVPQVVALHAGYPAKGVDCSALASSKPSELYATDRWLGKRLELKLDSSNGSAPTQSVLIYDRNGLRIGQSVLSTDDFRKLCGVINYLAATYTSSQFSVVVPNDCPVNVEYVRLTEDKISIRKIVYGCDANGKKI